LGLKDITTIGIAASESAVLPWEDDNLPQTLRKNLTELPTHPRHNGNTPCDYSYCSVCGEYHIVEKHHALPARDGGSDSKRIGVCPNCHPDFDKLNLRTEGHIKRRYPCRAATKEETVALMKEFEDVFYELNRRLVFHGFYGGVTDEEIIALIAETERGWLRKKLK